MKNSSDFLLIIYGKNQVHTEFFLSFKSLIQVTDDFLKIHFEALNSLLSID